MLVDLMDFLYQASIGVLVADSSNMDTLSWLDTSSGNLPLKVAWSLMRSHGTNLPWTGLIWNKFVNPRMACFSWRLLHRKTPTYHLAKIEATLWLLVATTIFSVKNQISTFFLLQSSSSPVLLASQTLWQPSLCSFHNSSYWDI